MQCSQSVLWASTSRSSNRTGISLGQDFTPVRLRVLSRATPSAVFEHSSELIGCPISRSLTTCCVRLELRSLPSTGITRLPPHGVRPVPRGRPVGLTVRALGLPVLRALSLCTCCRHYPGAAAGRTPRSSHPTVSAFPGRGRRVGLHID